jgi:hypothetical protein
MTGGTAAAEDGDRAWPTVVNAEKLVVTLPLIMAFWVPPMDTPTSVAAANPTRLRLRTPLHVHGYKQGSNLMCASIARHGSNIPDALLFTAAAQTDALAVDGRRVASKFVVSSCNAALCGGAGEISFTGFVTVTFSDEPVPRIERADMYFNGVDLRKQVRRGDAHRRDAASHMVDIPSPSPPSFSLARRPFSCCARSGRLCTDP